MVSIVIPNYNREEFLKSTLDSIRNQDYADFECIIVDDGSTDNSVSIIQEFTELDSRFKLYIRPDYLKKGSNICRNYGLSCSNGDFVKFIDSDDFISQDGLAKQVDILIDNKELCVCFGNGVFVDSSDGSYLYDWSRNISSSDFLKDYLRNNISWPIGGPLWKKSFLGAEPFNINLKNSQEWLMHGEQLIKLKSWQISNLEEQIYFARRGHKSISSKLTSHYLWNQGLARFVLYRKLIIKFPFRFYLHYLLLIKILIYFLMFVKFRLRKL